MIASSHTDCGLDPWGQTSMVAYRIVGKPERAGTMQQTSLGASGIKASVVGVGTWAIGGWMWGGSDERVAVHAIHAAIDAGINLIDTAPVYGFGRSETIVGNAIRDRRDRVVLATKCGLIWHRQRGEFFFASDDKNPSGTGAIKVHRCLAPEEIRRDVELSLQRLGTDRIDLLQTHWQDPTTPVADTMQTLLDLKAEGKILAIGCSNATPEQMDAYRRAGPLDVDQERYSMLDRAHEQDNLPYAAEHKLAFLAYSPLAQGLLTGTIGPEREFREGDQRRGNERFSVENRRRIQALLAQFRPIADAHGVSLGQLVIAWTVAQPGCTHALVGARTPAQAAENAKAGTVRLSGDELLHMRNAVEALSENAAG